MENATRGTTVASAQMVATETIVSPTESWGASITAAPLAAGAWKVQPPVAVGVGGTRIRKSARPLDSRLVMALIDVLAPPRIIQRSCCTTESVMEYQVMLVRYPAAEDGPN